MATWRSERRVTPTGSKKRTGTAASSSSAARLVLLSAVCLAGSGANAFVPAPRLLTIPSGTSCTVAAARRFNPIVASSSSMSADKDGGQETTAAAALSVAVAGAPSVVGAGPAAAAASTSVQQAPVIRSADSASLRALGPAATTVEGEEGEQKITGEAIVRRTVKTVARALPGTWWTAGLPKWMHIVRRRMITKEDWLHLHAASGAIYLVGGSLYLLNVMGWALFAGVPQLDTSGPLPLCILGAGLVNALSSFPMASTRGWVLQGISVSVMQLWFAWYASGAYPASLHAADPWIAAAGLTILVICSVEAEEQIQADRTARELLAKSGRRQTGKIMMRGKDHVQGDAINRYGALANLLFNGPHLYATLMGGGWLERLAEAYPAAPALLFHSYFALAASSSLALLAPTLYQRRLIDANGLSAMQFLVTAPAIMGLIDAAVMGSAATNNPFEIYLGFLH